MAAASSQGDNVPVTRTFLESLFGTLRDDFATLKQDITVDMKDIQLNIGDLGLWVDSLEQTTNSQAEELEEYHRKLLELQEKNVEHQYQLEDLANGSQCSNICIRGVPLQAASENLEDYVIRLF
ncbi:hypothetical protein NDU88_006220 [Pleurodeles waltl]|uniref:Uncharacterized protein n=1 Tax=Pleurodeles waltl TaxID=8319 RepID=A0AAV7NYQ8_PLEWA|nr:hypothetical protein NDU88_006220 [Pleurodeles waltl]